MDCLFFSSKNYNYNNCRVMIDGFYSSEVLVLLFFFFGLTIAVLVRKLRTTYPLIPYTPTLFLISIVLGYFSNNLGVLGESIHAVAQIDPHGILLIFLPPLIFESAFNSDWYVFRKQALQIFILAFPSVFLSAAFIMVSIKVIIQYDDSCYTWPQAFMFGSVLSCTDTVAVLALLKQAGAPRKFNSLIQGESLLNDGTCMILFTISLQLVKGSAPPPLFIGRLFLELTLGAIVLGAVFGVVSSQLIYRVRHNPVLTLNVTVAACYLLYFTAEYIDFGIRISGIMALVAFGLYMAAFGKTKMGPETHEVVENFWKIYIFIAESVIFILGGVVVGEQFLKPEFIKVLDMGNIQRLVYLYLCMQLCRFLSIVTFLPKLRNEGYGLKWKQVGALTYAGLRGAIGIAFTLILSSNPTLNPTFRMLSLFNTSGCAFLTLMIQAPTCNYVIRKIGLCNKSDAKLKFFIKFMKQCEVELGHKMTEMGKKKYVENASWPRVENQIGLPELKEFIKDNQVKIKDKQIMTEKQFRNIKQNLLSDKVQDQLDEALMDQVRNRFCVILKGILWQKFQDNQCSSESIRMLIEAVNIDMDSADEPLNSWQYLISHIHSPYFFSICYWLKNKPLIGPYAYSWIYNGVTLLYDVISTYLEGLRQCEQACQNLPYDSYLQTKVIEQSKQNRKLAQSYLDYEIKISYLEIMKRIQSTKAAYSILLYQREMTHNSYQYGQLNQTFYRQMNSLIEQSMQKLEKDSNQKQTIDQVDTMKQHQFFRSMPQSDLDRLLETKMPLMLQKDESVVKLYQKQKYIYLLVSGQVIEQYKSQGETVYRRTVNAGEMAGAGILLMNHKKDIEYYAVAQSVVSLLCFSIAEIKEIIHVRPRIQQLLYLQVFWLQVELEPEIKQQLKMNEADWKKRRNGASFKKLVRDEQIELENCEVVLAFGHIHSQMTKGYFVIREEPVKIVGPAKMYIIYGGKVGADESAEHDTIKQFIRQSMSSRSRTESAKERNEDSLLRRTVFKRH